MTDHPNPQSSSDLYVGLMSGTSIDAVDCALVRCEEHGVSLQASHSEPIPEANRQRIAELSLPGSNEIERLGSLDREIGALFARGALNLLQGAGVAAQEVRAIGSHGQTVRHRPPSDASHSTEPFTLQIGDPNTITELTGICTVADFRRRDIAAGGEGAPLAPAFHVAAFGAADSNRAIVNIGGIANISILAGKSLTSGFDCGPGNTLMDLWIREHRDLPLDTDGAWAATGQVVPELLSGLLSHPYLHQRGPRSTGKEAFNRAWLEQQLATCTPLATADVQATLAEFTAATIASGIAASSTRIDEVYVCGGGAHNRHLLERLCAHLPAAAVRTTTEIGIHPDWVEAMTFAWLAQQTLAGQAGNNPVVTGAAGSRILGGIYPA